MSVMRSSGLLGVSIHSSAVGFESAAESAASSAKSTNSMVELSPQNAYVRRLQHQLVERHELTARSTGKEPNRRLRIYTTAD